MKTKPVASFAVIKKTFYFFLPVIFFAQCRKDDLVLSKSLSAGVTNNSSTNGTITIQTGILPPVTQRSFIANGDSSVTQFQIISSRAILLRRLDFSAPQKFIASTKINRVYNYKVRNDTGMMTYFVDNFLTVGTGASLDMTVYYKPVNKTTSGALTQVVLKHISYVTEDNVEHDYYPTGDNKSVQMCLVYNLPKLIFQNPSGSTINNGLKEIAEIKLSGDTNWTLRSLPINISASQDYDGSISKSKLIVQSNNVNVTANSDSIQVNINSSDKTIIHFTNGFHHVAGKTEILKIYAPVSGSNVSFVSTMMPYNSFEWSDNVGANFKGGENEKFYKLNSGFSGFSYHK